MALLWHSRSENECFSGQASHARILTVKIKLALFASLIALLAIPNSSHAQTGARLSLRGVDAGNFPSIGGFVDARDANGNFIFGLEAADFTVSEAGVIQPVANIRLGASPARIAIVINPSEAFSIRDSQGFNRYDYVREALIAWALELESDTQLALIAQDGLQIPFSSPSDWISGFANYAPDFSILTPDLGALASALVLSGQPAEEEGTSTAILLISAAPTSEAVALMAESETNLDLLGIPLHVWLTDSSARFDLDEALALQNLAVQSGGTFYGFSGTEGLPDLNEYYADLGNIYSFQYISELRESGQHELILNLTNAEFSISSQSAIIDINLEAPKPIFLSPPAFIERSPTENDPEQLAPFSQLIEIIIEFPDGFERSLVRTSLLVDGQASVENRAEPFNLFSWDISGINSNSSITLQIEIEDELGLVGRSVEWPVQVSVAGAPEDVSVAVVRNVPQFLTVLALLLGGVVIVYLIVTERISPPALLGSSPDRKEREAQARDPLLDTPESIANIDDMAQPFGDAPARVPISDSQNEDEASQQELLAAFLLPLTTEGHPRMAEMMELVQVDHRFGSDKKQSDFVLEDPSVAALHSTIRRNADGTFDILDLGQDAGTWVNYAPITEIGSTLANGDLVHIGRAPFRFFIERPTGRAFRERKT